MPYQASREERFQRPDVHAGDRSRWRELHNTLSRSGLLRSSRPQHIRWQHNSDRDTEARRLRHRRSGRSKCMPRIDGAVSSGLGGDCFALIWDPNHRGRRHGKLRKSPRSLSLETARSRARWSTAQARAVTVSTPGALDGCGHCISATEN